MAAKKEPPKPLFPVKHEFYAALDNYINQAGALADAVATVLQHDGFLNKEIAKMIHDRLAAFQAARSMD